MNDTADISDQYNNEVAIVMAEFRNFGGLEVFEGHVRTLSVHEDNTLVREMLSENGEGSVLVVDGGGSKNCALLGGNLGVLAKENNWAGIVVNGCVRDSVELRDIEIGVKALSTNPQKSQKNGIGKKSIPLRVGGVTLIPGGYVYCDPDGMLYSARPLV